MPQLQFQLFRCRLRSVRKTVSLVPGYDTVSYGTPMLFKLVLYAPIPTNLRGKKIHFVRKCDANTFLLLVGT